MTNGLRLISMAEVVREAPAPAPAPASAPAPATPPLPFALAPVPATPGPPDVLSGLMRPPVTAEEAHADAMAAGARCRECPLFGCRRGPVPSQVVPNAPLTLIAEAPGPKEVLRGENLVGWSGREVNESLANGGLARHQVSLLNTIACQPPGDGNFEEMNEGLLHQYKRQLKAHAKRVAEARARGEALPEEPKRPMLPAEACRPRLEREVAASNSKVVLAVGKQALAAAADMMDMAYDSKPREGQPFVAAIKKQHGAPVYANDGRVLMSAYHPAMGARDKREWLPVIRENITRAARVATLGGKIEVNEPRFYLNQSPEALINIADYFRERGLEVTVDIETDSLNRYTCAIKCIGFGAVLENKHEAIAVAPIERQDKTKWWSPADQERIQRAIGRMLDDDGVPLAGQNFNYDTQVLLHKGVMTNRKKKWFDCHVDAETEFLTRRGWLKYDQVSTSDELGTFDTAGRLRWERPIDRGSYEHTGEIFDVETLHTRAVVTGNHRLWSRPHWRQTKRTGAWGFNKAVSVCGGSPDAHDVLQAVTPDSEGALPSTPWVWTEAHSKLLGLFVADGSFKMAGPGKANAIRISQEVGGRAQGLLEELQKAFGLSRSDYERDEEWRVNSCTEGVWQLHDTKFATLFLQWCGRYSTERTLPDFVHTLPTQHKKLILESHALGDGAELERKRFGDACINRTTSKGLADQLHALAVSVGWPSTIHRSGDCWNVISTPGAPSVVQVQAREKRTYENGSVRGSFVKSTRTCRVVCFQTPSGTLITRSHGRPAFHGNCMIAHHDTDDNDLPHNLSFIARRYFCIPMWKNDVDFKQAESIDDATLHTYNARDVLHTQRLLGPLRDRIAACGAQPQFETDTALGPLLREMGDLGMVIDERQRGAFSSMLNRKVKYHADILRETANIAGLNPRSTPQLQELFYERWGYKPVLATDGYEWEEGDDGSTSSASLIELKKRLGDEHPHSHFIDQLLEFRAYDKLRGTYTDNLEVRDVNWASFGFNVPNVDAVIEDVWNEKKGAWLRQEVLPARGGLSLLNTVYKAFVTPTGRLATEPAIQNWPALGKANMRKMGVAPPGHVIVGADYEQIEARLYAAMSGDRYILDAIKRGLDIHSLNAATLLAEREEDIFPWYEKINDKSKANKDYRKYWRTVAKNFGFLEIYGGEEKTLFTTMAQKRNKEDGKLTFPDITVEIVDLWHERWHRLHPETRQWHAACHAQQRSTGYACVPTLDGRKRWFPAGPSKKNAVPNMTIQGFAASIANQALLKIAEKIPVRGWSYWSGPFNQTHDYIGCYVPAHRAEEAAKIMEDCMFYEYAGIEFKAVAEISNDWAEEDKIKRVAA